jgi:hypothetical protein
MLRGKGRSPMEAHWEQRRLRAHPYGCWLAPDVSEIAALAEAPDPGFVRRFRGWAGGGVEPANLPTTRASYDPKRISTVGLGVQAPRRPTRFPRSLSDPRYFGMM